MYTLILTAVMFGTDYNRMATAHTVDHIDGFQTEQLCLDAGNAWLKQMRETRNSVTMVTTRRALCVNKGSNHE